MISGFEGGKGSRKLLHDMGCCVQALLSTAPSHALVPY